MQTRIRNLWQLASRRAPGTRGTGHEPATARPVSAARLAPVKPPARGRPTLSFEVLNTYTRQGGCGFL